MNAEGRERAAGRRLIEIEKRLEPVMVALGLVWLALTIVELAGAGGWAVARALQLIWIAFIADFAIKAALAPRKLAYVGKNWVAVLSLALPALRMFRVVRAARLLRLSRTTRGLRLVRLLASINRGMGALNATLERRGFGYVVLLTTAVAFAGAAGMLALEGERYRDYPNALWWTAMLLTTMGTENWPTTGAGRVLCFLLAVYAFAVFGYITATLASFFIEQDARPRRSG